MDVREIMALLNGKWTGTNQLWVMPGDPVRVSDTQMRIEEAVMGKFVTLEYDWAEDSKPQAGMILLGFGAEGKGARAAWADSWHSGDTVMMFDGEVSAVGVVKVLGSYSYQESPPWGWRIELEGMTDGSFEMRMYNITPEGEEMPAVRAAYTRAG